MLADYLCGWNIEKGEVGFAAGRRSDSMVRTVHRLRPKHNVKIKYSGCRAFHLMINLKHFQPRFQYFPPFIPLTGMT